MGKIKLSLTPIIIVYLICTCICLFEFGIEEWFRITVLCFLITCFWLIIVATICLIVLYIKTTRDEIKNKEYEDEKKDLFVDMGIDKRPVKEQLDEYFGVKKK